MSEDRARWRDDGHLTQAAVSAAADGQLHDAEVVAHLGGCDRCLQAMGEAAASTAEVDQMLAALRREDSLRSLLQPRRGRTSMVAAILVSAAMVALAFVVGRVSVHGDSHDAHRYVVAAPEPLRLRAPDLKPAIWTAGPRDCLSLELRQ